LPHVLDVVCVMPSVPGAEDGAGAKAAAAANATLGRALGPSTAEDDVAKSFACKTLI
jgi:hypothetical protein